MLVILFRSQLTGSAVGDGYSEMAQELDELVKTMPGFVEAKSYTAGDGERLTLVWWKDEETLRHWREQERHREAQRLGRDKWYQYYKIQVAEVRRGNVFERNDAPA